MTALGGDLLGNGLGSATPARSDDSPAAKPKPRLRFGVLADLHYADKAPRAKRHYRESATKVVEAVTRFREERVDFVVELGDLVDAADSKRAELGYLEHIERELGRFPGERHYVLGNHCVHSLTKREFIAGCAARKPYYSFDVAGFHFVVLDACYRKDGVSYEPGNFHWTDSSIPEAERSWLRKDLASGSSRTIVFVHQRLDIGGDYGIENRAAIREIFEQSKRVVAVFQGHHHVNDHHEIGGIHYCTIAAMVEGSGAESSAYGIVDVFADGAIRVNGFRRLEDRHLRSRRRP